MSVSGQVEWLLKGNAESLVRELGLMAEEIEPKPGESFIIDLLATDGPMQWSEGLAVLVLSVESVGRKKPIALLNLETADIDSTRLLVPPREKWGSLVPEKSDIDELYLSKFFALLNGSLKRRNIWLEAINGGPRK